MRTGASEPQTTSDVVRWAALGATSLVAGVGVLVYLGSGEHARHDPFHALQQFDAFYLDEPAPGRGQLKLQPGRSAVVFFCSPTCRPPEVDGAQVVVSWVPELARSYGLLTQDGQVGTGYALVDSAGRVRYRTFDPELQRQEIQVLVDALP